MIWIIRVAFGIDGFGMGAMKILLITLGCLAGAFVFFLIIYNRWAMKQSLLGAWVTSISDGSLVTIQFEGGDKEGTYKQLVRRSDQQFREFGHWTRGMGFIKMIIMATDTRAHPLFGQDTQYNVSWADKDTFTIDGPDRAKWQFKRATKDVRIEFDAPESAS
jgi:hypothetical protein